LGGFDKETVPDAFKHVNQESEVSVNYFTTRRPQNRQDTFAACSLGKIAMSSPLVTSDTIHLPVTVEKRIVTESLAWLGHRLNSLNESGDDHDEPYGACQGYQRKGGYYDLRGLGHWKAPGCVVSITRM
jgi:hypothetical protein